MREIILSREVLVPTLLTLIGVFLFLLDTNPQFITSASLLSESEGKLINFPDRTRVHERLEKLGRGGQYAAFRLGQFVNASVASGSASLALFLISGEPALTLATSAFVFLATYLLVDQRLSNEVTRYRLSLENEFAAVIEMLTLSLSAGETPLAALARISHHSRSALALEFRTVVDLVRSGTPFHVALDALGRRVDSVVIRRFVDALITAMLRGAPLVDVLQRHAAEARQNQRNILMNKAGKAEISMMVPVVFLILPVSVLFALWPSLTQLNFFAS
ncbi:MAG: type II secretion system F family protein [Actinobacteria bacterium]|nr:type II secretion system F family protein [Actinomycetota bacterium]